MESGKNEVIRPEKGIDADYLFLLPGNPSSSEQALSVQMTMINFMQQGKIVGLKSAKTPNIYTVRNGCLSEPANGYRKNQKPFEGVYKSYDRLIWVDSDNLINVEVVQKLIDYDVDIVAAWYRQYSKGPLSPQNKVACGMWELSPTVNKVKAFTVEEMPTLPRNKKGLVEVDFAGFGLMVIKKGVFEALEYPWFKSWDVEWTDENGNECCDVMSEDGGFCLRIREKGYHIYVDPSCQILHQKTVDL